MSIWGYVAAAVIQGLMEGQKTQQGLQTIKPELQAEVEGSQGGGLMDIVPTTPSIQSGGGGPGLGSVVDAYRSLQGEGTSGPTLGGEKPATSILDLVGQGSHASGASSPGAQSKPIGTSGATGIKAVDDIDAAKPQGVFDQLMNVISKFR